MKVKYSGISAVDIPGFDGVEPGDVIEVADDLGALLCGNGQWSQVKKSTPEAAPAVKES